MLFDVVGAQECDMVEGPVCTADAHNHGKHCMGKLPGGPEQLQPSAQNEQKAWVDYVHSLGMPIHAWTVRNEARPSQKWQQDCWLEPRAAVSVLPVCMVLRAASVLACCCIVERAAPHVERHAE